mmetsp:Transcript_11121/g.29557  ORF Transcript_11121/g.29557 Transcript_11121/m.29557 type:complete len:180 (-) Transcript_11121:131-670(-)
MAPPACRGRRVSQRRRGAVALLAAGALSLGLLAQAAAPFVASRHRSSPEVVPVDAAWAASTAASVAPEELQHDLVVQTERTALPLCLGVGGAALCAMLLLGHPEPAAAVLPPEETQGYVQNALAYANLGINFLLGFFGSLFGPIARQMGKPGPLKYVIVVAGVLILAFFGATLYAMFFL